MHQRAVKRLASSGIGHIIVIGLMLCAGCQSAPSQGKLQNGAPAARLPRSTVEAEAMNQSLRNFAEHFSTAIVATADEIAAQTTDRRIREMCLRWKINSVPAMRYAAMAPDPRDGLINAWMICIVMRNYLNSDQAREVFGEYQPVAAATVERLEDEIAATIAGYVSAEDFRAAQQEVEAFAAGYPVRGRFALDIIQASESARLRKNPILGIPVTGMAESAEAVDRLASVAAAFTEIVQDLPEYARWQAEALLLNLESMPMVRDTREDVARLSTSVESLSQTADTLPADVRAELEQFLERGDNSVQALRETITEARTTIEALDATAHTTEEVAVLVNDATGKLNEAATAWESTALAVNDAAGTILAIARPGGADGSAPEPGEAGEGFDIEDWSNAAQRLEAAAHELRLFLADLQSDDLSRAISELGDSSRRPVDHAARQARALVNAITWRAVLLLLLLFGFLLVYRVVSLRLSRPAA
jgi:hypothetical protein